MYCKYDEVALVLGSHLLSLSFGSVVQEVPYTIMWTGLQEVQVTRNWFPVNSHEGKLQNILHSYSVP